MKIQIIRNKYLNAFAILGLFSAGVHMVLLAFRAIFEKDLYVLNYFNVLDIDLFFPDLFNSFWGNATSVLFAGLIYLIILKWQKES